MILLDLLLPVIDGYEACRQLKKNQELKDIPVILLTASSAFKIDVRSMEKGCRAEDCLIKPFDPQELLDKVRKFVK